MESKNAEEKRHEEIIKALYKIADNIGHVKTEVETLRHAINEAAKKPGLGR